MKTLFGLVGIILVGGGVVAGLGEDLAIAIGLVAVGAAIAGTILFHKSDILPLYHSI